MSATDLLCLNRIIKPQIPLEEFLKFTADLGIKYVEVRNDFTNKESWTGYRTPPCKRPLGTLVSRF
jgi:predicted xylose isomerase-like sugar epimerase